MKKASTYLARTCPCCGKAAPAAAAAASAKRAEDMPIDSLVPVWNGFFKEKSFFTYVRCEGCGLLFAPMFFTGGQLAGLYAQMPPNMDVIPVAALRRTQRGYFDALKKVSDLRGGYIEIGPDVGLFTENCVAEGHFSHCWLFEPNVAVASALAATMKSQSFEILHDMSGFTAVPDNAASTIVMVHVLDHLLDPVATLAGLRRKMALGGKMVVVTHDESSLLPRVLGAKWPAYCLQHPQIYNPTSIRAVLEAAGFRTESVGKTVNHFPVSFLLKHLLHVAGFGALPVPSFGGLEAGLKLGNMITIATPQPGAAT